MAIGNVICALLTDSRLRLSLRLAHVMSNPTDFCRHLKRHDHQNQIKNVKRYSRVSLNHIPPARTHDAGRRAGLLVSVFCLKKVFLNQFEPVPTILKQSQLNQSEPVWTSPNQSEPVRLSEPVRTSLNQSEPVGTNAAELLGLAWNSANRKKPLILS